MLLFRKRKEICRNPLQLQLPIFYEDMQYISTLYICSISHEIYIAITLGLQYIIRIILPFGPLSGFLPFLGGIVKYGTLCVVLKNMQNQFLENEGIKTITPLPTLKKNC